MPAAPPPKRHPYDQWSPDARALDLVGDKWTVLIVRDLAAGPRRFVEIQRVLPGIWRLRLPLPWRRITTPWNTWIRERFPSVTRT